ncbi:hypothetical protein GLYMA_17G051400v4 [Glycine max]|uniref:Nuclear transcription factor Y subunit n=1 Tax=Glycine soja TaxID=3848 RepID=A0A445G274_GLYSO|nr:hypothetical protein GLYMA_17G051400v4 [Glycine max]KAH1116872.1 hypothetical protein GYH30_046308 [Glycine max]KAH1201140.1 Nuclear transcription factor Y subunit A-3 [Glycine max]RZB55322.1 Nuclear transcription factor Y subunit A-3 isoform A [Glycine soja]RZB55326.1 Nuclear transcription factor Y subunit A-3 isoform E [Glycine soja]
MKPFLSNHTDSMYNCSQVGCSHPMVRKASIYGFVACSFSYLLDIVIPFQAHTSYPCGDPYFGSSIVAYGPQAINQQMVPQMLGLASTRIALPVDLAEDGPIYVNAKQYHGILRRRQSRAKLEAQNKLIKSRKPYLHESRHRHALNRVRGSGGRFLSAKQLPQSNAELVTDAYQKKDASEAENHPSSTGENASITFTAISALTSMSSNSVNFPNMAGSSQCSGGLTFGAGALQCTSVGR